MKEKLLSNIVVRKTAISLPTNNTALEFQQRQYNTYIQEDEKKSTISEFSYPDKMYLLEIFRLFCRGRGERSNHLEDL